MNRITDILVWILIILLSIVIFYMYNIDNNQDITNKKIDDLSSQIHNDCSLPYWVQDKIEQTYEYVTSATCINK